jgi:hypothetical protein
LQTKGKCYNNLAVRDPFPNNLNPTVLTFPNPIFIANPQQSIFSNTNNFPSTDLQTVGFISPLGNNFDLVRANELYADYSLMNGFKVNIYDNTGKQVFNAQINSQQFVIKLSTLGSKGVYTLHLLDSNNNSIQTKQIVLE